jgi:hypothetical protein
MMSASERTALEDGLLEAARDAPSAAQVRRGLVHCLCLVHDLPRHAALEALELAGTRWTGAPGTLLLLTDVTDFGLLRRLGHRVEILPARTVWRDAALGPSYDAFAAERTAHVMAMYQPRHALGVGGAGRRVIGAARETLLRALSENGSRTQPPDRQERRRT